jgi:hypothetical protein
MVTILFQSCDYTVYAAEDWGVRQHLTGQFLTDGSTSAEEELLTTPSQL